MMNRSRYISIIKRHHIFILILFVYLVLNLATLTTFPAVSEDEGFLSNWSRVLDEGGIPIIDNNMSGSGVFKDHKVFPFSGILFYATVSSMGRVFDYTLYYLRLQPMLFSMISLIFIYLISLKLFDGNRTKAYLSVFITALSSQFIVVSHTIRQESMLIANLLAIIYFFIKSIDSGRMLYIVVSAILAGAAVSIHPNGIVVPLMLIALFVLNINKWNQSKWIVLLTIALGVMGGLSIYLIFDYYPYREHYWKFLSSPFMDGLSNHYERNDIVSLISLPFKTIWHTHWNVAYHRYALYLFMSVVAIAGGIIINRRAHRFLLGVILLIYFMIIPFHPSYYYILYFIPFVCILFSSVCIDILSAIRCRLKSQAGKYAVSTALAAFIACYAMYPIVMAWCYRNYDYRQLGSSFKEHMLPRRNVLCSSRYFLEIEDDDYRGNMYSLYLATNYDVHKLIRELKIEYIILDTWMMSVIRTGNASKHGETVVADLMKSCSLKGTYREYKADLNNPSNNGHELQLLDCSNLLDT